MQVNNNNRLCNLWYTTGKFYKEINCMIIILLKVKVKVRQGHIYFVCDKEVDHALYDRLVVYVTKMMKKVATKRSGHGQQDR